MRKYLFILMLTLFCSNARAEWQKLGETATETAYVNSIEHRAHNKVRMWGLFDLKTPRAFGDMTYSSMKIQREYHCADKTSRVIAMAAFTGKMGSGEVIYSNNAHDKWAAIQPDSAEEALWNIACKKTMDH